MTDYFALLQEPRRPWLDPALLKAKFLARSAELHPDRVHGAGEPEKAAAAQRYVELNSAFNCLREPKERLRHLLELELGRKPEDLQEIPADLADLFMEVAQLCRQVNAFLAEQAGASSPVLRVPFFERGQEWSERLGAMQQRVRERQERLIRELQDVDAEWNETAGRTSARAPLLRRLEEIHRLLSFYARWNAQIQEAIVQLTMA
jgi:DnaJ-domain-containing protein 1